MNELENVFGYPEPVWRRFVAPSHTGTLDGADALQVRATTPASNAAIELAVRPGAPVQARFRALGCPVTIAVGEWLAETLERDGLAACAAIDAAAIRAALEIPDDRPHCGLMGEDLVRALMKSMPSEFP